MSRSTSISSMLYISRSALLTQQNYVDVIANNIANINTVGFKRTRAEFHELLSERIKDLPPDSNRGAGQAAGTSLNGTQTIFTQGILKATENPWDLAIEGSGFFQVQMPDGEVAYTRDGLFKLDADSQLINANGYFLTPPITVPPDAEEVMVAPDGVVMVRRMGEAEPTEIGEIQIAQFENPAGLTDIGENLYQPTDASGQAVLGQPQTDGRGQLIHYAYEASNVDLSQEIVDLITAQRAYTLSTRALQTTDEMLNMATQLRG